MDPTELSAGALSRAIHSRTYSCVEVMRAYQARIDRINPICNALVSLCNPETMLEQARRCDSELSRGISRGWMHGMPQAIKDLAATAGLRTTMGSPLLRDSVPTEDGLMVARMRASGAIIIGKSNTPEFGLGSHTFNPVFGATANAYEPSVSAGGSSGGAAVALAHHMLPVADGSDFMGSLRNPAAWNNIFGLRPSQGRIPQWPVRDVWINQMSTEGPMARCTQDLWRLLQVQSGADPRAPLAHGEPFPDWDDAADAAPSLKGLRVGWLGDLNGYLPMEPGVLATCERGLARLATLGADIEPATLGSSPAQAWQTWLTWRHTLIAARLAPYLQDPAQRAQLKPEALWEAEQARNLSALEVIEASAARTAFYQNLCIKLESYDFLAIPSAQIWPFPIARRWPEHIQTNNGLVAMDTYHRWMEVVIYATLAGLPCISVPCGFNIQGLPMGMQWIGRPRGEAALLRSARAYEAAIGDWLAIRPVLPEPRPDRGA